MKKWLSHIIYIAALAVVTSCSSDLTDDSTQQSGQENVTVTFTLAMNEPTSHSRVSRGENEESENDIYGNDYENQIELGKLQVVIYSASDNSYIGKVENISHWRAGEEKYIYTFIGNLKLDKKDLANDGTLNCKIMVFANCPNVTQTTTLNELNYHYDANAFKAGTQYISMWGVRTYKNLKLTAGNRTDLGTIDLLRAMAKVEVKLSDEVAKEFALTGMTLNKYNAQGYCLPTGYAEISETTELISTEGAFNVPTSSINEDLAFKENNDKTFTLYLPEYDNSDEDANIEVCLKDNKGREVRMNDPHIYFKDYATGTAFNIVRNYYYQYIITKVNQNIEITYTICPWESRTSGDITFN